MILEELREVINVAVQNHPGRVLGVVLLHLAHGNAGAVAVEAVRSAVHDFPIAGSVHGEAGWFFDQRPPFENSKYFCSLLSVILAIMGKPPICMSISKLGSPFRTFPTAGWPPKQDWTDRTSSPSIFSCTAPCTFLMNQSPTISFVPSLMLTGCDMAGALLASILGLSENSPSTQMAEQKLCRQDMSPIRTTSQQRVKENRQPGLAIISLCLRPSNLPGPLILSICLSGPHRIGHAAVSFLHRKLEA